MESQEQKPLSAYSYAELIIKVQQLIGNVARKNKRIKELELEMELLKSGRKDVMSYYAHNKITKQTLKQQAKGMPKQLRKLNGCMK